MRKIYKLLVPAFIAVALFASCEDKMDDFANAKEDVTMEKKAYLPPKSKIKLPPHG